MHYNDHIETEIVSSASEPISLDEAKEHLRLQFDTAGSYDFDDDDNKLQSLIVQSRETVENYTGLSFMEKSLRCILRNECGGIEIPYGPVSEVTSIKDSHGNDLMASAVVRGNRFKWIESPRSCYLDIEYEAGYTDLPRALREAILQEIAYRYSHRGDEEGIKGICQAAMELSAPYKRTSLIA